MKKIIICGATSGLGLTLAKLFISHGWIVGAAGRNLSHLQNFADSLPAENRKNLIIAHIDILAPDASEALADLISRLGGIDIYLHCSGVLPDESNLEESNELLTVRTNAVGFTTMIAAAFRYFHSSLLRRSCGSARGRIVAISSIAGFRGLGDLPAYSASKAFDSTYLEALRQRADALHLPLDIIDIRPGWTRTPLLDSNRRYMLEMDADRVSRKIFYASLHARRSATIGLRWRLLCAAERLLPAPLWQRLHLPLWKTK